MTKNKKIHQDKIPTLTPEGELVGVYTKHNGEEILLGECSREQAKKIINFWNKKNT